MSNDTNIVDTDQSINRTGPIEINQTFINTSSNWTSVGDYYFSPFFLVI